MSYWCATLMVIFYSDLLSLSLYYWAAIGDLMMHIFLLELGAESVDIVSMVFVLSAIHPQKHKQVSLACCYH
jgi:hypothetical protein